ncbi:hypothetical protein E2C01_093021 [Portunus trituberculatus]|uniref:Uncharacterized protein n=1 Tax=Portunus trituberculatus TaxID=210409 RepID=A0A5B7JSY4_PORTR|nr:hypothetical protein [Portunus trituberculatus]
MRRRSSAWRLSSLPRTRRLWKLLMKKLLSWSLIRITASVLETSSLAH